MSHKSSLNDYFSPVGQVSWGGTTWNLEEVFIFVKQGAFTEWHSGDRGRFLSGTRKADPSRWWRVTTCPTCQPSSISSLVDAPSISNGIMFRQDISANFFSTHTSIDDTHVRLPWVNRKQHRARLVQSASRITLKVGCEFYFSIQSGLLVNRF